MLYYKGGETVFIKSSEYLCDNYKDISELTHVTGEPIFITHNDDADTVIMSIEFYESISNSSKASKRSKERLTLSIEERSGIMGEFELANILKEMYDSAGKGEQVAMIHLFSIKYANELEQRGISKIEILKYAGLPPTYQTEISKGIKIAKYVDVKPEYM